MMTLSRASFHRSRRIASKALPVLSKVAQTISPMMCSWDLGPCFSACFISVRSLSTYTLRSKPRRPRCCEISVTFFISSASV